MADDSDKPKTKRTIKTNTTGAKKQAINNTATIKRTTKDKRLKKKQRVVSLANDSDDDPSSSDKDATAIVDLPNPGNDSDDDPSPDDEDGTVIIDLPNNDKKARVRKPEALQLESAAYRVNQRAGVQLIPCDSFGCRHMGLWDIYNEGAVKSTPWLDHHLKPGGFLDGEECAGCSMSSENLPRGKVKGMDLCYICEVGTRPTDKGEYCNHWYCPDCMIKALANMEKEKSTEGVTTTRTSSRIRKG
jgi:hypothetical protein